jgi:hypothetical protein
MHHGRCVEVSCSSIQRVFFKHPPWEISGDGLGSPFGPGCLEYRPAVCGPQNKASRSNICHVTPDVLQEPVSNGQKIKFVEALRSHFSARGWQIISLTPRTHTRTHACIYIYTQTRPYTHVSALTKGNVIKMHLLPSALSCRALLQGPFARHRPDIYHIKSP